MDSDRFWQIIGATRQASGGDAHRQLEALEKELTNLSTEDLCGFQERFDEYQDRAYTWDLWAAAYIISGGCSDDGFEYFRSWLISMGRDVYERALADPQSLAEISGGLDEDTAYEFEEFAYAAQGVYKEKEQAEMPPRQRSSPSGPRGQRWDEDDLPARFPKLWTKFAEPASIATPAPSAGTSPPLFGQPVNQAAIDARVQDGVIVVDLSCKHCGYNLRTRGVNDVCPECGSGVLWSLRGNELAWSDPDWLGCLHRGVFLQVLTFVLGILLMLGLGLWISVAAVSEQPVGSVPVDAGGWQAAESLVEIVFGGLGLASIYFLTRPDPASPRDSRRLRANLLWWTVAALGLNMFSLVGVMSTSVALADLAEALSGFAGVFQLVAAAMMLIYLRRLGRRTEDTGIVKFTSIVLYSGLVVGAVLIVAFVVSAIVFAAQAQANPGGPNTAAVGVAVTVTGGGACAFFIVGLLYILLIDRYRRLFKKCRAEALQRMGSQGPTATGATQVGD